VTVHDTPVAISAIRSQRVVGRGAPLELPNLRADVIAIFGPTASGKTAVAARVAARLGTEVVSADALQVYRGLEILTNQPLEPTHLVGIRDLTEPMSVGEYAALAHSTIDELVDARGCAVVAGGTGLYLRAALADLAIPPAVDTEARAHWEQMYDESPEAAYASLIGMDPAAAAAVHPNDRRRVVRALELAAAGSSLAASTNDLWSERTRRATAVFGLDVSSEELTRRIAARTDAMLARGAVEEARAALARPISRTARQALGLEELASLPRAEARERVIARTVQYAAYQRKWMRRIPGIALVDGERPEEQVASEIVDLVRAR
jgi:tRNA dimethylallyltransferase